MRLLDLLLRLYAHIELEEERDQNIKDFMVEETREMLRLYEKGLRWCEIKKHLIEGCDRWEEEATKAGKNKLLEILRRRNPKIERLTKDCRKER